MSPKNLRQSCLPETQPIIVISPQLDRSDAPSFSFVLGYVLGLSGVLAGPLISETANNVVSSVHSLTAYTCTSSPKYKQAVKRYIRFSRGMCFSERQLPCLSGNLYLKFTTMLLFAVRLLLSSATMASAQTITESAV